MFACRVDLDITVRALHGGFAGFMWDYVFDWTILKYQQSGRPLPVHEVREADRAPGDARRTTAEESGTSTANRPSNSMGQNLAATSRPRPARYATPWHGFLSVLVVFLEWGRLSMRSSSRASLHKDP